MRGRDAGERDSVTKVSLVALPVGALMIGVVLWAWGQPLISASGEVRLWVNQPWSSENSQQVADWYTLSHVIHGFLLAIVGRALWRQVPWGVIVAIAFATGVGWEIIEHTDMVLNRFRGQTIYQGYIGDSVLNAVCDFVFMWSGFLLGSILPVWLVLALILGMEAVSATIARDSLILTTIRVVHPIQAISDWQDATNPLKAP
jgi:Protein of unknown function (DUF2585)